ncbi:nucleoside 2-deoxyribosyltransferase [Corticibacter populi]|uniref:Nucleoside 2-deoxyribosyltransferase n=1 Tax=Corticibacter populi TaxID=1550736 RepID=A0A3M6QMB0_9BURK|nr:nucleoside 2-deoxyribosyltransferase [Corticibacter populi]RMX03542.1 nucleoside 2-deoxyribosyltransferase [Corticibacter populi]RZS29993.1 nucleoside 2-deoxyribosyltransferase [Corticibacter populi]
MRSPPLSTQPRIYLAGPDVFLPDQATRYAHYKQICARLGLCGLSPLDGEVPTGLPPAEQARHIYQANIALLASCDAVIANLCAFRGTEPDAGTVFEVGHAIASGKPVAAWLGEQARLDYLAWARQRLQLPGHAMHDADGAALEDFGLPLNLMLACSCTALTSSFEEAAQALARHWQQKPRSSQ